MNFAFAELRTFPEDAQKEDSPTEQVNPEESTPEEGMPEEVAPEEGTQEEGDEMQTESDDSEVGEDLQPTFKEEYVLSMDLSLPIYTGTNLESRFDNGLSFGFEVSTPFAFEVAGQNIKVSAELQLNSLKANDLAVSRGTSDYTPMLLGAQLSSKVSVLELSLSSGLTISSGDVKTGEEYSMTTLYARAELVIEYFLKVFHL